MFLAYFARTFQKCLRFPKPTFLGIIFPTPLYLLFNKEATCHFLERAISQCAGLSAIMMSILVQNGSLYVPKAPILFISPVSCPDMTFISTCVLCSEAVIENSEIVE